MLITQKIKKTYFYKFVTRWLFSNNNKEEIIRSWFFTGSGALQAVAAVTDHTAIEPASAAWKLNVLFGASIDLRNQVGFTDDTEDPVIPIEDLIDLSETSAIIDESVSSIFDNPEISNLLMEATRIEYHTKKVGFFIRHFSDLSDTFRESLMVVHSALYDFTGMVSNIPLEPLACLEITNRLNDLSSHLIVMDSSVKTALLGIILKSITINAEELNFFIINEVVSTNPMDSPSEFRSLMVDLSLLLHEVRIETDMPTKFIILMKIKSTIRLLHTGLAAGDFRFNDLESLTDLKDIISALECRIKRDSLDSSILPIYIELLFDIATLITAIMEYIGR